LTSVLIALRQVALHVVAAKEGVEAAQSDGLTLWVCEVWEVPGDGFTEDGWKF
jgi:hypothetical protein